MRATTEGEILQWMGPIVLGTRFEFKSRRELWSTISKHKFLHAPAFGRTGMSRDRFDNLWRYMRWSYQPDTRPPGMSREVYSWRLVDDHVFRYNKETKDYSSPSERICVDESMSR